MMPRALRVVVHCSILTIIVDFAGSEFKKIAKKKLKSPELSADTQK
jgi:hypothetical protein